MNKSTLTLQFYHYRCKDIAYVIKELRHQNITNKVSDFNRLAKEDFPKLYDIKQMVTTHRNMTDMKRLGLVKIMKKYGIYSYIGYQAHNAACDARMTLQLFRHITDPNNGIMTNAELEEYQNKIWSFC